MNRPFRNDGCELQPVYSDFWDDLLMGLPH